MSYLSTGSDLLLRCTDDELQQWGGDVSNMAQWFPAGTPHGEIHNAMCYCGMSQNWNKDSSAACWKNYSKAKTTRYMVLGGAGLVGVLALFLVLR